MNLLLNVLTLMISLLLPKRGIMKVVKVADKAFIGKDIIHVAVFQKNDERTTYNMIYVDGKTRCELCKAF